MKRWLSALMLSCCACVSALAHAQSSYTQTYYPVVLVHGLFGFEALGPVDYFWRVPDALRAGGATVYTAAVSQANNSVVRGEQLLRELETIKARTGAQKFNLIGHSHGGQTIRYVAAVRPDLVASVTSVGTPHQGSKTADGINAIVTTTGLTGAAAQITNGLAELIGFLSGNPGKPQDSLAAMLELTTAGSADFNRRFPQGGPTTRCGSGPAMVNGARYFSIGGTSVLTNVLDITDGTLALTSAFFGFEQNDGLVSRCSSRWGVVLRDDYPWNHGDEVNQVFGLRGLFTPDPVGFYRAHANRLKNLGL
ncbi:MAG: esterase/lipase family protein [Burkholderiaceae bacterium]